VLARAANDDAFQSHCEIREPFTGPDKAMWAKYGQSNLLA
jgi:hypothetical protein